MCRPTIRHVGVAGAALVAALVVFLAFTVIGGSAAATGANAPGSSWQKVPPSSVGLDAAKLNHIAQEAKDGGSSCLVVVRDGKLAGEWNFHGTTSTTTQNIWSATKSFASTLVGIAQDEGHLQISDSASKWIPQWQGTPSEAVTVRDLLSMDSGREWSFQQDYVGLIQASDRTAYATGLGQSAAPGTTWTYNNSAVQTLEQVLRASTGQDVASFAQSRLFGPLGMTHTKMTRDKAGNPQLFEGIESTCLDLARFGQLMLNKGNWNGKQLVSSSWVAQATGHSSTKLNAGYGYLWWENHEGTLATPRAATSLSGAKQQQSTTGRIVSGAPDDLYWALGLGDQLIQVDPATKTVVVRLGAAQADPKPPTFGPANASQVVTQAIVKAKKQK